MAVNAVSRPPDILIRTAPALSATADAPLDAVPKPPVSASNHADDQQSGVPAEMSLEEKAAADFAKTADAGAEAEPQPKSAKTDVKTETDTDDVDVSDLPPNTPTWAVREITIARKASRTQVAEAAAAVKAANDAAEAARAELAAIRARLDAAAAEPAAPAAAAADTDPRPTRDGFDDPDSYDVALTEWAQREGERKAQAKIAAEREAAKAAETAAAEAAQKAANEAELVRLNAAWAAKRLAAAERYPDYAAVAEGDHPVSMPMAHAIMLAENGADVAYHLGKNPEESARIAALPNVGAQMFEIGRLSAMLAAPVRRTRQRPIEPIEHGNAPADTSEREPSMDEWAAKRTPEIRNGRRPFFNVIENVGARH